MANNTHDQSVTANMQPVVEPPAVAHIAAVIQEGLDLQAAKKYNCTHGAKRPNVCPVYKCTTKTPCPACTVRKIEYPDNGPPPPCRHHERTVPSRYGINRRQHLMLLSAPNPNRMRKPRWPTVVERPIHCATYRLARLAEPRRSHVHNTWRRFANVLDPYHIENCRKRVQDLRLIGTTTAIEYFTQKQRYAQFRRAKRHAEIGELRKQIRAFRRQRNAHYALNIMRALYLHSRAFLLANNVQLLTQQRLHLSQHVLQLICQHIGYVMPTRRSKALFDTFVINLADNLAIWLSSFASNSRYDIREEVNLDGGRMVVATPPTTCVQPGAEPCLDSIPIDDYVDTTDDESSAQCTDSNLDEEVGGEEEEEEEEGDEELNWGEEDDF